MEPVWGGADEGHAKGSADFTLCRAAQPAGQPERVGIDPVALLLATYLCRDLTPAEVAPLAAAAHPRHYLRGQQVFAVGDQATHLHVVGAGSFKESLVTLEGEEYISELYWPRSTFGEPGLFVPERDRVVGITALEDGVVYQIAREDLLRFLFAHPSAMLRMLEAMSALTRELSEVTVGIGYTTIRDRLAVKLSELAELRGVPHPRGTRIDTSLSQSLLAGLISASRPNVNRALAELIDAGHVWVDKRDYVVANSTRLRAAYGARETLLYRRNQPGS